MTAPKRSIKVESVGQARERNYQCYTQAASLGKKKIKDYTSTVCPAQPLVAMYFKAVLFFLVCCAVNFTGIASIITMQCIISQQAFSMVGFLNFVIAKNSLFNYE